MKVTTERRQLMIEYICQVRYTTRPDLMREFNDSKNTVDRDLEILMCSYPIETSKGKGGGIRIADDYRFGKRYLTEKQKDLLERLSHSLEGEDLITIKQILLTFQNPVSN